MGHGEEAPYDAIHVGAAAPTVPQAVSPRAPASYAMTFDPQNEPVAPPLASLPAPGPAEARGQAHPARRPRRGEPDAGAVRQAGGRQHQNEALDGGDLCAFNRQRKAVVQVEVNSFFPPPPPLSPHSSTGERVWLGAANGPRTAAFGCSLPLFCFFHTIRTSIPFKLRIWVNKQRLTSETCRDLLGKGMKAGIGVRLVRRQLCLEVMQQKDSALIFCM